MQYWYNVIPLLIIMVSLFFLFTETHWQRVLAGFVGMYFGVFLLLIQTAPFSMALAKMITGFAAAAVLFISLKSIDLDGVEAIRPTRMFKIASMVFFWVVSFIIAGQLTSLIPVSYETICGALLIIMTSLLQLGMSNQPVKVSFGLLILYAGFDLIYGSVESSILVNGLLAITTLLIAFVSVYIVTSQHEVDS